MLDYEAHRRGTGGGKVGMKLGSLFDGSGTAPLAAAMCGIDDPVAFTDCFIHADREVRSHGC